MVVSFRTRRENFPSNPEGLKVDHVGLYFARENRRSFEVLVSHLKFTEDNGGGPVGGGSTSIDGVISTRRGIAGKLDVDDRDAAFRSVGTRSTKHC